MASAGEYINFTSFFAEEKEIFIQNLTNKQVPLLFNLGDGRFEPFLVPAMRDPVNISQYVPFKAIKDSADLRRALQRSPPLLRLLDRQEYDTFFKKRAKELGLFKKNGQPDAEAAMHDAEVRANAIREKRPLPDAPPPRPVTETVREDTGETVPNAKIEMREMIRPKIMHLMSQVSNPDLSNSERMPAAELLKQLEIEPNLTADELEFIQSRGHYKSIRKWAHVRLSEEYASRQQDEGAED